MKKKAKPPIKKMCGYCGHSFKTLVTKQIYCSRLCANRHTNALKRHARVEVFNDAPVDEQAVVEDTAMPEKHSPWGSDMFGSLVSLAVWLESVGRTMKDTHERLSALEENSPEIPDMGDINAMLVTVHENYTTQATLMCNVLARLQYLESELNIIPPGIRR